MDYNLIVLFLRGHMLNRIGIPVLPPDVRKRTFEEIVGEPSIQWVMAEARRCLLCYDAPCRTACPAGVDVPRFIRSIRNQNLKGAIRTVREANCLPGTCARVCPTELQCEGACSASKLSNPIVISALQRFVADEEIRKGWGPENIPPPTLGPVAIIGSGPSGLSCATECVKLGIKVFVFEAEGKPGGLPMHAIPRFRLPRDIIEHEIRYIQKMGVQLFVNKHIDDIQSLFEQGFRAVFVAVGLREAKSVGLPGENLKGVVQWTDFLKDNWEGEIENVIVVGGGNSAVDTARVALRRGASSVIILYRRDRSSMPAFPEEIIHAEEEGVGFIFLAVPVEFMGRERVEAIRCIRMSLGEKDLSGRAKPIPIEGSDFIVECNLVVLATGQTYELGFARKNQILFEGNGIICDENLKTRLPNVWAGGDCIGGGGTVVKAVADGKKAAKSIYQFLRDQSGGLYDRLKS